MALGGVEVRRAEADDVPVLAEVHLRTALHAYEGIFPPDVAPPSLGDHIAKWSPALVDDGSIAYAGELDGSVVGGVIASLWAMPGKGHLRHLYVDPRFWGRGVGRALHDEVLRWCAAEDITAPDLWVLEANTRSRAMYERWGWQLSPADRYLHPGTGVAEVRYVLAMVSAP